MFYESNYFGMDFIWWIVWILLIVWIFAIPYNIPGQRSPKESPLDILKKRFASGQINKQEYEESKKILNND